MGQNDAVRPEDVSKSSGPLWCVPVSPDAGAVWGNLPAGHELTGIEGPSGLLAPLERHRIFSPSFSTFFHIVPIRGLQDGLRVRLTLRDNAGVETQTFSEFRLAHWQVDGTPQIVSFLISRVLPNLEGANRYATLDRYLALLSAWRAPCRLVAKIADRLVYSLDSSVRHLAPELAFIFASGQKLHRAIVGSFGVGDGTALVVPPQGECERAYTDIDGELVQFDLVRSPVSDQDALSWLRSLPAQARHDLIDRLSALASGGGAVLPPYIASAFRRVVIPLAEPEAQFSIEGVFVAEDQLLAFIECVAPVSPEHLRIELFADESRQAIEPALFSSSCPGEGELQRIRLVAKADLHARQPGAACKIVAEIGGRQVSHWVHIQIDSHGRGLALAQAFWPLAEKDERFLTEVASPLARAWVQESRKAIAQRVVLAPSRETSPIDLQIIAEDGLDALRSTLLGVRSSVPAAQALRLVAPAGQDRERLCEEMGDWVRRYALEAETDLIPATAPMATAAHAAEGRASEGTIALRAGFIPPYGGWLDEVSDHLRRMPATALVGVSPAWIQKGRTLSEVSADDFLALLADDAIVAIALSSELRLSSPVDAPVCHTLIGGWAERLIEIIRRDGCVMLHPALGLYEVDSSRKRSVFGARIDRINLARKIAAAGVEERPMPCPKVVSA